MGNWFCDKDSVKNRGLIFGLWTCHQYCGDITAALCTAWVLGMGLTYWWALLIPSLTNLGWGFLTRRLIADPADVGIITDEVRIRMAKLEAARANLKDGETIEDEGPKPISYSAAIRIPMVAQYAVAFGFFKLTNYVLFFWLPYFLGKNFDPVTANLIAACYSVGMMPGGIIVGFASDLFGGRRASVIGVFMVCLIISSPYLPCAPKRSIPSPSLLCFVSWASSSADRTTSLLVLSLPIWPPIPRCVEAISLWEPSLALSMALVPSLHRSVFLPSARFRIHSVGVPFGFSSLVARRAELFSWLPRFTRSSFPMPKTMTPRWKAPMFR